jgi:hypothetical protein
MGWSATLQSAALGRKLLRVRREPGASGRQLPLKPFSHLTLIGAAVAIAKAGSKAAA